MHESPAEPRVLMSGLVIGESPRWHDGRLWFAHWGAGEIIALDIDGRSEVVAEGPPGLGWSIDWLHDGRLLVTGEQLMRREADGSMVRHADLSSFGAHGWNEIVVDGRGNIYLNAVGFRFGQEDFQPGIVVLVTPDGSTRQVAEGIAFPNGMAVTPDNSTLVVSESFARTLTAFDIAADGSLSNRRIWADGVGPDGICVDAEGAVWTGDGGNACVRVREGGEILARIALDRTPFACMLGGPEGSTLFIMVQEWRMGDTPADNMARLTTGPRTGRVLAVPAPAPGAGWP
ncbi:MAG TPA: SMP-30/gluconolactonase/LRE family protein [Gaiellales bacterium]|jgi:sugar lactone lactonase YvrE|nr:SMP-30/gluconolactonase/LRE family protein [Gaiellales bacterium]